MISNDLFIIEAINGLEEKIISLQQDMKQNFDNVNKRIDNLQTEIKVNTVKIEAVHDKVNWGFSLTTVFIGIVGGLALLIPAIKALSEYFANKKKNYTTIEQVQDIVEKAIGNALAGKLR